MMTGTFSRINTRMIYSGNDQDGSQDGHQTGRQESADSDRLERYGKTTCKESEINPARHLKKNVSISNMTEEYGFGKSFDSMDFDELFANSGRFKPRLGQMARYVGSIDEGISSSIDIDSADEDNTPADEPEQLKIQSSASKISRVDSVMERTFRQMLVNNFEKSQGYLGFRRRAANDINHKYCSFCRCDDTLFIVLHVVFGIVCIIAGVFGVMECNSFGSLNYFLFLEGIACVFLFPILIMNWAKHIGGCVHENQKVGNGLFFLLVLVLRTSSVILGNDDIRAWISSKFSQIRSRTTELAALEHLKKLMLKSGTILFLLFVEYFETETIVCHFVQKTFLTVIIFGWSFLVFVIFLPFCWYGSLFSVAKFLHVRQLTSLDDKAVDSLETFTADKTTETPDYQIVEKAVIAEDH